MTTPVLNSTNDYKHDQRLITLVARWIVRFAYLYAIVTQVLLGIGFFLQLFGADPNASFVAWVYRSVAKAMEPFRGIFNPAVFDQSIGGQAPTVFDASLLLAILVYGIMASGAAMLVSWLTKQVEKIEFERLELSRQRTVIEASRESGYHAVQAEMLDPNRRPMPQAAPAQPRPAADPSVDLTRSADGVPAAGQPTGRPAQALPPQTQQPQTQQPQTQHPQTQHPQSAQPQPQQPRTQQPPHTQQGEIH